MQTDDLVEQPEPTVPDVPQGAAGSLIGYAKNYWARVKGGELGSIPAIVGLVVISAFFAIVHKGFLSAYNIEALVFQAAAVIIMAMGLIFVLLLGEIDLSAGTTGGLCAAIMAVLLLRHGWNEILAMLVGLAMGMIIGFLMGWLRAKIGIPSFVITLATFLGFQGITLIIIGGQGSVTLPSGPGENRDSLLLKIENNFVPLWLGWVLLAVVIIGYALVKLNDANNRRRAGLRAVPLSVIGVKVLALAALGALFVYIMGINRILTHNAFFDAKSEGMPWSVVLIMVLFVIWNFVLTRTRYGRHIYALGGNEEATRRAGIAINRVRISVFVICSGMAAISGIVAASQLSSVQSNAGGGNTLLLAVGAAVIGGTSLFGGRGRMIDAVLGGLVVTVITNGMSNLIKGTNNSGWQQIVTGAVLLLAAGFDAVVRSRSRAR
jgi:D-xylose transport system permease protein